VEITVNDAAPTLLSYTTPNVFTVGVAIADLTPTITGNVDSWSISPNLPDGLSFDPATGTISGTPTAETENAVYTVTATNSGGSVSFDVEILVEPELGLNGPEMDSLTVYPNPFINVIYVKGWTSGAFTVFAADGRLVRTGTYDAMITLDDLPAGMYLLRLESNGMQTTRKMIKQ